MNQLTSEQEIMLARLAHELDVHPDVLISNTQAALNRLPDPSVKQRHIRETKLNALDKANCLKQAIKAIQDDFPDVMDEMDLMYSTLNDELCVDHASAFMDAFENIFATIKHSCENVPHRSVGILTALEGVWSYHVRMPIKKSDNHPFFTYCSIVIDGDYHSTKKNRSAYERIT